jgi:photosystem II stability/assembly factor-like uncharacterized protein
MRICMKAAVLVIVWLSSGVSAYCQTGWAIQSSTLIGLEPNAVHFFSPTRGGVACTNGRVLLTTDAGISWLPSEDLTNQQLFGIYLTSPDTVIAVGGSGVIVRSTNSGALWSLQQVPGLPKLNRVRFFDRSVGLAVGTGGTILKSTDGGISWISISSPTTLELSGLALAGNTATAVGNGGAILRSTDRGDTWQAQSSGVAEFLNDVSFADALHGGAVTASTILRTTDGGALWTSQPSLNFGSQFTIVYADTLHAFIGGDWVSGGSPSRKSTDGGLTWSPGGILNFLVASWFVDSLNGFMISHDNQSLYVTTDRGATWIQRWISNILATNYYAVVCLDTSAALAAGTGGTIIRTTDAGSTWLPVTSGTPSTLYGLAFPSVSTGFAVGDNGAILRSVNGGTSWSIQSSGTPRHLRAVAFANLVDGVAAGDSGTLLRTTNGGSTWLPIATGRTESFLSVAHPTPSKIVVAGLGLVITSNDAGATWTFSIGDNERYTSVAFADTLHGLVLANLSPWSRVWRTTDGGAVWTPTDVPDMQLNGIAFPDTLNGFAIGASGRCVRSANGGATWMSAPSGTAVGLHGIAFADSLHGFAVGDAQTILHTSTGGVTAQPPPYIYSPVHQSTVTSRPVYFGWGAISANDWYQVQIGTSPDVVSAPVLDTMLSGSTLNMQYSGVGFTWKYYWRIRYRNAYGTSPWTAIRWFQMRDFNFTTIQALQLRSSTTLDSLQNGGGGDVWLGQAAFGYWPQSEPDSVKFIGVCVVPPDLLTVDSAMAVVLYDTTHLPATGRGIVVRAPGTPPANFLNMHTGDVVTVIGGVDDVPRYSANSMSSILVHSVQITGTLPVPGAVNGHVHNFHFQSYPEGLVRYTTGEQYEGMIVSFHNLTVTSYPAGMPAGTFTMQDAAGNEITISDLSRWFTLRAHRDSASTYALPPIGSHVDMIRGVIVTTDGPDNDRGYLVAPVLPGDLVIAGVTAGASVEGTLYSDLDGDGARSAGEPALGRWQVTSAGVGDTVMALTDPLGAYRYRGLAGGIYRVTTAKPGGWIRTNPPGDTTDIPVPALDSLTGRDFGLHYQGAVLTGVVFEDLNGDSMKQAEEPALQNWKIYAEGWPSFFDTTSTDSSGVYRFERVPYGGWDALHIEQRLFYEQIVPHDYFTGDRRFAYLTLPNQVITGLNFVLQHRLRTRIPLVVSENSYEGHREIFFGIRPGASFGMWGADPAATRIDSAENEFDLPPQLAGIFDGRFVSPRPDQGQFWFGGWTDMRDFTSVAQIDSYRVSFKPGTLYGGDYPFTFRWSRERVKSAYAGPVTIVDQLGHVTDMKARDDLGIDDHSITYFRITASRPNLPAELLRNWKLLSIPTIVINDTRQALYPSAASSAFWYDPLTGYQYTDNLQPGLGYWLRYSPLLDSGSYRGTARLLDTVEIKPGWNLIGTLSVPISVSQVTGTGVLTPYYGYGGSAYTVADSLEPGKGYWVKSAVAGNLVLDASAPSIRPAARSATAGAPQGRLEIHDALGQKQVLRYGMQGSDISTASELPPLPPEGCFDVRFSSNTALALGGERITKFPVSLHGIALPLTLEWRAPEANMAAALDVDGTEYALDLDGAVTLDALPAELTLILGRMAQVPGEYRLGQNYPNPFNPSTTLRYELPAQSKVKLAIFTALGQRLSTLVDEVQEAGYHRIVWKSADAPSGVYFYRLETVAVDDPARSFTAVKKMILMK